MFSQDNIILIALLGGTMFILLLVASLLLYVYLHQMKVSKFRLELREQEIKKQQELFFALSEGEEKERKRLAEELHDGIGAKLSGLKMSLEYLMTQQSQGQAQPQDNLMVKISNGMNETIQEVREISRNLKPSFLSSKGLSVALGELVDHLNTKKECSYQLFIDVDEHRLHPQLQLALYRIVSELLNNIHKHSHATQASAQLMQEDGTVQIIVEDDGKGFDIHSQKEGIGITNIKSRVELYKGKLNIDSSRRGTITIIELPIIEK